MNIRRNMVVVVGIASVFSMNLRAGEVVLTDDFGTSTSWIDTRKWQPKQGLDMPRQNWASDDWLNAFAAGTPEMQFVTVASFNKPVSVEFKLCLWNVQESGYNVFGFVSSNSMWTSHNAVGWKFMAAKGRIFGQPYTTREEGASPGWHEHGGKPIELSTNSYFNGLMRIDWTPGVSAAFYLNGELKETMTQEIARISLHFGTDVQTLSYGIDDVKISLLTSDVPSVSPLAGARGEACPGTGPVVNVPQVAEPTNMALVEAATNAKDQVEETAVRAREASDKAGDQVMLARISERVKALGRQFSPLRMVIGVPNHMWGIDLEIAKELKAAGMHVFAWPDAPLLNYAGNQRIDRNPMEYNVILFGDTFYQCVQPDPNTGALPQGIKTQAIYLKRFLEAGGGIWFCGLGEQNWGRSAIALNYILKELNLDAEVVGESLKDTKMIDIPNAFQSFPDYTWVDVPPDPLNRGVTNLLHPCSVVSGEGSIGAAVISKLGPEWRVLLRGKDTAFSCKVVEGVTEGKLQETSGTVKSAPVLCAARQSGKGRVVLWPTWSCFTATGGSGGALVDGEMNGQWSDGARLIENLLCWLAEPGQGNPAVGIFDPEQATFVEPKIDIEKTLMQWAAPGRRDFEAQFKGLIGAHSSLSDGASTPEQMISAAKQAGYQFIAFTEDISKLTEAKWNKLLEICDRSNAGDPNFRAFPGWDFMDEAGDRGVVFGHRYWIRDEWRSKENPDCLIQWCYNLTYQSDANPFRWPPRVIIRSQSNNKRPWNQGLWSFLGAYCYEGGKLVDDSLSEWARLPGRYAFIVNSGIMAVHTVHNAEEIAAAAKPGLYQTYVRAESLQNVLGKITGCIGPVGYFPVYVSTGPEIVDFKCYTAVMGGEHSYDLSNPENDRGLLHILAKADAGLKEVSVYEGERLVRRFLPEGSSFETCVTIHPDACHAYSLRVSDKQGNSSVSWPAYLQIQECVQRRSGDNWNWQRSGRGPGLPKSDIKFGYNLFEVTYGWTSQEFLPAQERKKTDDAHKYLCEQGICGNGGLSAAINGYIWGYGLLVDEKPWSASAYPAPAMTLDIATIGRFGSVQSNTVREEMVVPGPHPGNYMFGAFSGPYKVIPSPWPADLEQFVPFQKPAGASINRYRGTIMFTKEVRSPDAKPIPINLGATGTPGADTLEVMNADGKAKCYQVGNQTLTGEIPAGGYICWYDDQGKGLGGIIALSPCVGYSYNKKWQQCSLSVPSPIKADTNITWDLVFVTADGTTINTNQPMLDVWQGLGITGEPTLYKVKVRTGKVVDQKYFLTLKSKDHGFSGTIVKTGKKLLPIHLPVFVQGVNPRWDAAIWYRGKSELNVARYYRDPWGSEAWQWVIADYHSADDVVRYIPVINGNVAYCQVETDKQDPDVFIGNLLVCDRPEVFISVYQALKGKCVFEVNNPTDNELTVVVRPAKGFDLTGKWEKKIVLPAGGIRRITVNAS